MTKQQEIGNWKALPEDFRKKVVKYLQEQLSPKFFEGLKKHIEANGEEWWALNMWHFGQGMSIRNMIRNGGFDDDQLPTGNWDDYYIQALEDAAGLIP